MPAGNKTLYIVSDGESRWSIRKAGRSVPAKTKASRNGAGTEIFHTQRAAVKAASKMLSRRREGQVVLIKPGGEFVVKEVHGFPVVQNPPGKSSLGRARIAKAVTGVLRKRLETV